MNSFVLRKLPLVLFIIISCDIIVSCSPKKNAVHKSAQKVIDTGIVNDSQQLNSSDPGVTVRSPSPINMSLTYPEGSGPYFESSPTVRVGMAQIGDVVKIYSGRDCLTENLVAAATARSDLVDVVFQVPLTIKNHELHATFTRSTLPESACSSVNISYNLDVCPDGYIPVGAMPEVGVVGEFCVAKYEMKQVSNLPQSVPGLNPWVNVNFNTAKSLCESVDGTETHYFLMSNAEWMAIARDIEMNNSNWHAFSGGPNKLNQGNTTNNASLSSPSDDDQACYGLNVASSDCSSSTWHEKKRTHTLSNGMVIWDISGNVAEWVDWTVSGQNKAYSSSDSYFNTRWFEFYELDMMVGSEDTMSPITFRPLDTTLGSSHLIGMYYSGLNTQDAMAVRGGYYSSNLNGGIFTLDLSNTYTSSNATIGFRCVFRL